MGHIPRSICGRFRQTMLILAQNFRNMNQVEVLQNILATSSSSHQTGHSQDKNHAVLISLRLHPASTN